MKRIGILGIGGVGGYFGGKMSASDAVDLGIEVVFLAREKTVEKILNDGLKIISENGEMDVFPKLISSDANEIGVLDYLICTTKTYDLDESLEQFSGCIGPETVILPLYNGVDGYERMVEKFPNHKVLNGCVYIFSALKSRGIVEKVGNFDILMFGGKSEYEKECLFLKDFFDKCDFESHYYGEKISAAVWEKFVFISTVASLTSYLNQNIGEITSNMIYMHLFDSLLEEVLALSKAKGIVFEKDIIEITKVKLMKSPKMMTSSMQRDFAMGNRVELESLTGYVVKESEKFGLKVPNYQKIYGFLK